MRNPWLCIVIAGTLGVVAVTGMVGLVLLPAVGVESTGPLVAIVSGCVGSLSSFLVSVPRGSVGVPEQAATPAR